MSISCMAVLYVKLREKKNSNTKCKSLIFELCHKKKSSPSKSPSYKTGNMTFLKWLLLLELAYFRWANPAPKSFL